MDTNLQEKMREKLHRQLSGTKATFDEQDVQAYFDQIIAPVVGAAGIRRLSVVLRSRTGEVIAAELQDGFLGEYERYAQLTESVSRVGCSFFSLNTNEGIVAGYSENDWDWVVLKYEDTARDFLDPILTDFWTPFFDFA
ncbi:MAG: hypothetical protein ACJ78Q_06120 [Chloroflexia bacterium]